MEAPTIVGDVVTLRPWDPGDASWYVASRDEEVFRWTREPRELTPEQCEVAFGATDDGHHIVGFLVADSASGERLGSISVRFSRRSAELSYWVSASARGRGIASAALRMASDWAHADTPWLRLELVTHPANVASQAVARRAGYEAEGLTAAVDDCADDDGNVLRFVMAPRVVSEPPLIPRRR